MRTFSSAGSRPNHFEYVIPSLVRDENFVTLVSRLLERVAKNWKGENVNSDKELFLLKEYADIFVNRFRTSSEGVGKIKKTERRRQMEKKKESESSVIHKTTIATMRGQIYLLVLAVVL